jgi:heme/copper-type cytochrome/quinol oxidase subunit 3
MHLHAQIAEYAATPVRRRTLTLVAANFTVFAVLVAAMFYIRTTSADWPTGASAPFEFGSLLMVSAMAMSAICASITMAVGANSAAHGKFDEAVRWIAIAISAWLVFLFLEIVEWVRMVYLVELGPKTPFGGTFLVLTGAHWLAVIVCTIWFTFAIADVRRRDILAAALYSHFLAIWWIVLVILVYLPNMNPLADL